MYKNEHQNAMNQVSYLIIRIFVWVLSMVGLCQAVPLSVTQGRASQRAGMRLVDVYYDISGGLPPYSVTLQGSLDGGTTWTLPVTTVTGNVGAGVTAGTNRVITWNAGTDWAGQLASNVKFRVTASDTPPVPDGFALIPAGSFSMGNALSASGDGYSDELPVHTVQVSAFYMAKYLVTKELWDDVRTWGLTHNYTDLGAGAGKAANHPVQMVTWYDMVKWCNARSEKEGLTPCYTLSGAVYRTTNNEAVVCNWASNGYRLPTEAEWEKAARGGLSGKRFPWGDTISQNQANYCVYSSNGTINYYGYDVTPRPGFTTNYYYHPAYDDGVYPYTSPVGSFAANGYGLYDMAGNLWVWCWDWYGSYTAGSQTDPRGAASGLRRVLRGGHWGNNADYCRVAFRGYTDPDFSISGVGFRPTRSSVP